MTHPAQDALARLKNNKRASDRLSYDTREQDYQIVREALQSASREWMLMDENTPKTGGILVCGGTWGIDQDDEFDVIEPRIVHWKNDGWSGGSAEGDYHDSEYRLKPKYWMPLPVVPTPPKQGA